MVKIWRILGLLMLGSNLGLSALAWAAGPPVAMLLRSTGLVEYQKPGGEWKKVSSNKLLFDGYRLRTAANSAGLLLNQATSGVQEVKAESEVMVANNAILVIKGVLSPPDGDGEGLLGDIQQRFASAQRYTTVRRGSATEENAGAQPFPFAKQVTLSATYPELVWENLGVGHTYELMVDGKNVAVIASNEGDMIRHPLAALQPGSHVFQVRVSANGQQMPADGDHTLVWLSAVQDTAVAMELEKVGRNLANDGLILGTVLDKHGLSVAAMDRFRDYFATHSDENEARAILIMAYDNLKLQSLKQKELAIMRNASRMD